MANIYVTQTLGMLFSGGENRRIMRAVNQFVTEYEQLLQELKRKDLLERVSTYPSVSLIRKRKFEVVVYVRDILPNRISLKVDFQLRGDILDTNLLIWGIIEEFLPDKLACAKDGMLVVDILGY